ncbi:unnamed protein product [Dovyalis caffra]|uniref:Protein kinase domain-containing protein n=1 Tax=Dovyalis caffra TaxID=77055 RepID=A0AAV1SHY8_9ROSI|nr:unnamed protein product [Dovyalis caffra]
MSITVNTTNSSETTKSPPPSPGEITSSPSPQERTPSPWIQQRIPSPLPEIRPHTTPRRSAPIIAGVTGIGLLIISFVVILILRAKWCGKSENVGQDVEYDHIKQVPGMPVRFSYEELCVATDDFKEILGRGGFGSVFKGKLADGTEIAVKRLEKLGQGMSEFLAEAEAIGSLHHFNLVWLIGFCAEKSFRLLVFEYLSNGSNVDVSQPESAFHLLTTLQKKADQDRVIDMVETSDEYTQSNREEMLRMIHVAAWCLQDDPERRPLMSTVLKVLEGVMEVDSNINFQFSHALIASSVDDVVVNLSLLEETKFIKLLVTSTTIACYLKLSTVAFKLAKVSFDHAYMHVMGASDYQNACYNAFRKYPGLAYPSELASREAGLKHICDVVLGFIDHLGACFNSREDDFGRSREDVVAIEGDV